MQRKHTLGLALILLIFIGLQLTPMMRVNIAQYDESIFLDIARNIRRTGLPWRSLEAEGKLELDQTPLYLYVLSGLTLVVGENLLLLRLVTLAAALACLAVTYLIGQRARGPSAGLIAAGLLALNPFFHLYSFFLRMEVFAALALLLATFLLVDDESGTRGRWAAAGGLIAAAVLLKVVAVTYWLAALLWTFWRGLGSPAMWRRLAWLALPTLAGLGLWLLMMQLDPGRAASAQRWWAALGLASGADIRQSVGLQSWLQTIGETILGREMVLLLAVALTIYLLTWRKQHPVAHLLVLYIGISISMSLVVSLKEARHLIGIIPAAALLIGLGINWDELWRRLRRRPLLAAGFGVAALVLLWGLSPLRLPAQTERSQPRMWWEPLVRGRYFDNDPVLAPLRDAGLYLATHAPENALIVIARQGPVVGYYAGRHYVFLYTRTFDDNMRLLGEAEWLVMDPADFWLQTPEETARLHEHVAQYFVVEQVFENGVNSVILYRRAELPSTP